MEEKIRKIFGITNYFIAFIFAVYYLVLEFSILNITSPIKRLKIIFIVIILMYIGSLILNKIKTLPKINMWIWFSLYLIMLLNLTLFDQYFGRQSMNFISNNTITIKDYLNNNFNIIPFATINNYILALKNNNLSNLNFIYNIFGNLLAFAPLALFLPRLFNSMDKWYKFFIITSIFIFFIETMQMVTMSGSFDIDDYILNITGSIITYCIVNNKKIKKYIDSFINLNYLKN